MARGREAALLVVGSSRRTLVGRVLGVGYDGSPECEQALRAAQDLAAGHVSRYLVGHVGCPLLVLPHALGDAGGGLEARTSEPGSARPARATA